MFKIFIFSIFLFSAISFYDLFSQKYTITVTAIKKSSIVGRKIASNVSDKKNTHTNNNNKTASNKTSVKNKINFKQWSSAVNYSSDINLNKKIDDLKKLSPSELMKSLRAANTLSKPKRMQALRTTAKRFIPESLLFYLAGNLVSLTDYGFGISEVDNPRFFQTELDSILSLEGGAHFFSFIFFNQLYSAWSIKKVQSGTASVALNKFLKSAANSFAGMAVAGLGASIVSDLGSMIYNCGLNKLEKVEKNQVSDIFATTSEHFAACDDLYLRFVSGKMQSAWVNELALGLIPAAALSHGVGALGKKSFKQIGSAKNWLKDHKAFSSASNVKKIKVGKFSVVAGKIASGAKVALSATWVGALVNFSLFVGIERLLMSHVVEWSSKKINLRFLNSYKNALQIYFKKSLFSYNNIKDLEQNSTDDISKISLDQCSSKECIKDYYTNSPKALNAKDFLKNLKLYSQTLRERRKLLLSKGQMNYQNWLDSFKKLSLKHDASFQFYYDFIQKISNKDESIQSKLMPLVYILPNKKENDNFAPAAEFAGINEQENLILSIDQKKNLTDTLVFINKQLSKLKKSTWFLHKKSLIIQLTGLKRQLFSKNLNIQSIGFKNLQTLSNYHNKKFTCHSLIQKSLNCSVVYLYNHLGKPESTTYLEKYIKTWGKVFDYSYGKDLKNQAFAKNLAEDFLLSMVCGKTKGELSTFVGWDKNFYPPKVINLKNNSCKFNSIKTPYVHMLCDSSMSKDAININSFNIKKPEKLFKKVLTNDFKCAKLWNVESNKSAKYSVMSTYFAVNDNNKISAYNNLAELVIRNLKKTFLICSDDNCRQKIANAKLQNESLSVFKVWWTTNVNSYVLDQMDKARQATQKILNQEILPTLYEKQSVRTKSNDLSIIELLDKEEQRLSVMESLEIEFLVYINIIKNIYKKHCKTNQCIGEFNQWHNDAIDDLRRLSENNPNLKLAMYKKRSKLLKTAYQDMFYKLVPNLNFEVKSYYKSINKTFKISNFEKKVLTQTFKYLNAQLFELSGYKSLLLER
ncbi:MAG: hypothetical protein HAW60_03470 [Bdellovibrionales bacterium]|nr:hypothetical protein [Bdellovibrionales bacterium]